MNLLKMISINMEKYMAFTIGKLLIIDSFQILDRLVGNMDIEKLIFTKEHFGNHVDLMKRKGVYPYEYMNCFDRF